MFPWVLLGIYRILLGIRAGALWAFLPLFLSNLGANYTQINLSLALPASIALLFLPYLGFLSDRVGQRIVIIAGEMVAVVSFLLVPGVSDPWIVLLLVSVAAASLKIAKPLSLAGIGKLKMRGSALGVLSTLGDLSGIFGTALGTLAVMSGYSTLIVGLSAVSFFSALVSMGIPEVKYKTKRKFKLSLGKLFKTTTFAAVLWIGSGAMVEQLWNPLTSQFTSDVKVGILATAIGVALAAANVSGGVLLDLYKRFAAKSQAFLDALLLFSAPLTSSFLQISGIRLARVVPYAVQRVFVEKAALDLTEQQFGLAVGTMGSLVLIADVVFPIAGGILADNFGYIGVYWVAGMLSLLAFWMLRQ